jgi:WD40 repeat protein
MASADDDHVTRVRQWPDGGLITEIKHDHEVHCVAFSADSTRIVTGGHEGQVEVWDALTGTPIVSVKHGVEEVYGAAFSPDCTYFATGGDDTWARVWDATTGEELACLEHNSCVRGVAFSPDGTLLATASWDDTVRISRIHY